MSRTRLRPRSAMLAVASVAVIATLAGCAGNAQTAPTQSPQTETLTIYTDQHASLITALTSRYTELTGVHFNIQQDATVGQIEAEGAASPADLFLSEDPAPVARLGASGALTALPASIIDQVQPHLSSPDALWVAYAARARVLFYNPNLITENQLPKTLLEITQPQFRGEFAYAPSGAFVATTQYLISTIGIDATKQFLEAVRDSGINEHKNGNVRDTVEAGKHPMGLSNHYYWWIKAAEVGGPANMVSKIHHFEGADAGNLVLSSGAGILATSKHKDAAEAFLAWLTSAQGGQQIIATGDISVSGAQYPVAVGASSGIVGSLADLQFPRVDMGIFADQSQAEQLLKTLGISG